MATLSRIRVSWSGSGIVGPGVSTFYSSNSAPGTFLAALRSYFQSLNGAFPNDVTIDFPASGETINDATGEINGTWTATQPDPVVGQDSGAFAMGVGYRQVWNTAGITRGRLVRGSTYLVPLAASFYENNGLIDSTLVNNTISSGETLLAADSGSMRVWSRPTASSGTNGTSHAVTSTSVNNRVSWLRSRRV